MINSIWATFCRLLHLYILSSKRCSYNQHIAINVAKDDNFIILGQYKPIANFFHIKKAMRAVVNKLNSFFFFLCHFNWKFRFSKKKKSDMTKCSSYCFQIFYCKPILFVAILFCSFLGIYWLGVVEFCNTSSGDGKLDFQTIYTHTTL